MISGSLSLQHRPASEPAAPLLPRVDTAAPGPTAASAPTATVESLVQQQLQQSGYVELRAIDCNVSAGTVQLNGQLPSFYLKQTAQELVRRVAGVRGIRNHVQVVYR